MESCFIKTLKDSKINVYKTPNTGKFVAKTVLDTEHVGCYTSPMGRQRDDDIVLQFKFPTPQY